MRMALNFLFQKTHGNYTGWISYTLAQATNHFDVYGGDFPANQDVRDEFKMVHVYRYQRWAFSASWIFATGHAILYVAPLSSYTINDFTGNNRNFPDHPAQKMASGCQITAAWMQRLHTT